MAPSGRQRRIYFYEPVILDQENKLQPIQGDFWDDLHAHVMALDPKKRNFTFFGRPISGEARKSVTPPVDYFYLDRERPGQDWPDARGNDGHLDTLHSQRVVASLHEPAYLLPVSGTPYISFVRTSAGPSTAAVETWLNLVMGFEELETRIELRAFARTDAMARLARATSATKVHVVIEPDAMTDVDMNGDLGQALAMAQRSGNGGVSVDMTVSFGNVAPDDESGRSLVADVSEVLNAAAGFRRAEATVVLTDDEGEIKKQFIDFKRDRVTISQAFGTDLDQEPTPQIVLEGLMEAIRTFRPHIE